MNSRDLLASLGFNCRQWRNSSPAQKAQVIATRLGITGNWMKSLSAGQVRGLVMKLDEYCQTITLESNYSGIIPAGQTGHGDHHGGQGDYAYTGRRRWGNWGGWNRLWGYRPLSTVQFVLPTVPLAAVNSWARPEAYGYTCSGWYALTLSQKKNAIVAKHPDAPSWGANIDLMAGNLIGQIAAYCARSNIIFAAGQAPTTDQSPSSPPATDSPASPAPPSAPSSPTVDTVPSPAVILPVTTTPAVDAQIATALAPHLAHENRQRRTIRAWQFITVGAVAIAVLAISTKKSK